MVERNSEPSGRFLPSGLRWAGPVLAACYGYGVRIHRAVSTPRWAPIATICVGNLTVGGTGKTPAAIYVAKMLARLGRRPAILMRGYKAQGGDEAEEVKAALRELSIPVILGSDRFQSALAAAKQGCDVALLDDGFQHWRLARDLDIVLIDATDPFGGRALLPHGSLREPLAGLQRAGAMIVTRADNLSESERTELRKTLEQYSSAPLIFSRHEPASVRALTAKLDGSWALEKLKNLRVLAACGIGNPGAFRKTLVACGADVADVIAFGDHHDYTERDLIQLMDRARAANAAAVCVTEKDAVKIEKISQPDGVPILALRVELSVDSPDILQARIEPALKSGDARRLQKI